MPEARPFPTWRQIEAALIELLREEGFEIEQEHGESYITIDLGYKHPTTIFISGFAHQLEERL